MVNITIFAGILALAAGCKSNLFTSSDLNSEQTASGDERGKNCCNGRWFKVKHATIASEDPWAPSINLGRAKGNLSRDCSLFQVSGKQTTVPSGTVYSIANESMEPPMINPQGGVDFRKYYADLYDTAGGNRGKRSQVKLSCVLSTNRADDDGELRSLVFAELKNYFVKRSP